MTLTHALMHADDELPARGEPEPARLAALVAGDEPVARIMALRILHALDPSTSDAEAAILPLVDDPATHVRPAAVRALAQVGSLARAGGLSVVDDPAPGSLSIVERE